MRSPKLQKSVEVTVQAVVTGGPGIDESLPAGELAFAQYALLP